MYVLTVVKSLTNHFINHNTTGNRHVERIDLPKFGNSHKCVAKFQHIGGNASIFGAKHNGYRSGEVGFCIVQSVFSDAPITLKPLSRRYCTAFTRLRSRHTGK